MTCPLTTAALPVGATSGALAAGATPAGPGMGVTGGTTGAAGGVAGGIAGGMGGCATAEAARAEPRTRAAAPRVSFRITDFLQVGLSARQSPKRGAPGAKVVGHNARRGKVKVLS